MRDQCVAMLQLIPWHVRPRWPRQRFVKCAGSSRATFSTRSGSSRAFAMIAWFKFEARSRKRWRPVGRVSPVPSAEHLSMWSRAPKRLSSSAIASRTGPVPRKPRNGLTEDDVRAMKYKGAQESEAHRRLKGLIERSLRADLRFENVKVETTWHAQRDRAMLRRPDVQAITAELRIAFEAQLTTTFLDVVIGRKNFYRSEGGLLVWILPYFDPTYRQLTVDDLLFNNNANVFVIDRESTEASETANRFIMRCAFRRPVLIGDSIGSIWESKLVAWGDLTIDLVGQRAFIFDCEREERALIAAQKAEVRAKQDARDQILRDALFAILSSRSEGPNWEERFAAWSDLKGRFAQRGLRLAGEFEPDQGWRNVVCGMLSALAGHPIGYGFEKLIQVAHHLADRFPMALVPFGTWPAGCRTWPTDHRPRPARPLGTKS